MVFRPEDAFFILDSEHLEEARSAFYGFTYLDDAVTDRLEDLRGREPEADGAWVYVRREDGKITVTQDFMGSYGLYLYRQGEYFALSNSFLYLVEYLRSRRPLTLNKEYADYLLIADLCSNVFDATLVQEITLLDRGAAVEIWIPERVLRIRVTDYLENTVDPASPEGLAVLDGWRDKWVRRIQRIAAESGYIRTDLSGGFDSRETLTLFLSSGIDLNEIQIFSNKDGLHTHSEDFQIASRIAEHYGFQLNGNKFRGLRTEPCTLDEILNICFYVKLGFHKQMYYTHEKRIDRKYTFTGNAGACIRDFRGVYGNLPQDCIQKAETLPRAFSKLPPDVRDAIQQSAHRLMERSFQTLRQKFADFGRPLPEDELTQNLNRETRCRHHFGKSVAIQHLVNGITVSPLLDPDLFRLKLKTEQCPDYNLLSTLILERFAPGIMDFGFDGGRSVAPETIAFVKALNEKYPCPPPPALPAGFAFPDRTPEPEKKKNVLPKGTPDETLRAAFRSEEFRRLFNSVYDDSVYRAVEKDLSTRSYFPLSIVNIALAIGKVQRDVEISALCMPFAGYLREQAARGRKEAEEKEREKEKAAAAAAAVQEASPPSPPSQEGLLQKAIHTLRKTSH